MKMRLDGIYLYYSVDNGNTTKLNRLKITTRFLLKSDTCQVSFIQVNELIHSVNNTYHAAK